jgi:aminopeptidase-like protein
VEYDALTEASKKMCAEIDQYMRHLFPITRSITGPGNRDTLKILQELIPLTIKEYTSGTPVYDWIIPEEWQVRDAWIKDSDGNKLIDFQKCNIHLVSYSESVHKKLMFSELKDRLHQHPDLPEAIPYRTTYYNRNWGFCGTHQQIEVLSNAKGPLEVFIDSDFNPQGSLTVGELLIPGELEQEILISTYICHPSLANDNLSGAVMTAFLARELLKQTKPRYSYRIIWVPETIGAISYCAMNEQVMKKITTGFVVTTVGGPDQFGYKQSYNKEHPINTAIEEVFKEAGVDHVTYPFDIHGSDERQYSSQGFRINTASITKGKYYEYPFYHTSLDNLDFVKGEYIEKSLKLHLKILEKLNTLELSTFSLAPSIFNLEPGTYKNLYHNCEVMLSKHDLYPKTGGAQLPGEMRMSEMDMILWLLWYADGTMQLETIANQLDVSTTMLKQVAARLVENKILKRVD